MIRSDQIAGLACGYARQDRLEVDRGVVEPGSLPDR
jgi:hypothetical protein